MKPRFPLDPYLSLRYRVVIDRVPMGDFSEVTGLQIEVEVEEIREGGVNGYMHRLAGPAKFPSNLILKHGLIDADSLWTWMDNIMQGLADARKVTITLMDSAGQGRWKWEFRDAYPIRWSGPDLRAGTAEVAIETLELAHRGLLTSTGKINA